MAVKESVIEEHLVKLARRHGGEVRKVQWIGRSKAPDRVLMMPGRAAGDDGLAALIFRPPCTIWVELKNPETIKTFPADAHERAQHREHKRMRAVGQRVEVIGTLEQVEALFR